MTKRIYLGGDAESHELRSKLKDFFRSEKIEFVDLGLFNDDKSDYQDIVREVTEKTNAEDGLGLLVFGKKNNV
jgi:ribose 5-phosphate isomerase RpiB